MRARPGEAIRARQRQVTRGQRAQTKSADGFQHVSQAFALNQARASHPLLAVGGQAGEIARGPPRHFDGADIRRAVAIQHIGERRQIHLRHQYRVLTHHVEVIGDSEDLTARIQHFIATQQSSAQREAVLSPAQRPGYFGKSGSAGLQFQRLFRAQHFLLQARFTRHLQRHRLRLGSVVAYRHFQRGQVVAPVEEFRRAETRDLHRRGATGARVQRQHGNFVHPQRHGAQIGELPGKR
ncbi:MAG: hypothetical protein BWY76_00638 [bacterium ADurb.Bin429]|nr:MAG: hypothetical protein BWY76_00638 [bacterium ADurb.Bin429]